MTIHEMQNLNRATIEYISACLSLHMDSKRKTYTDSTVVF